MRSLIITLLPLLSCTMQAAADINTVLRSLSTLNNDLNTLNSDVLKTNSDGILGVAPALQVEVDSVTVDNDLIQALGAVQNSAKFSASDSQSLINELQTIGTTANTTLQNTVNQNATFGGLAPIVLASLYQLKYDQNQLGLAFYSKLDSSSINQGVQIILGLNKAFNAAILAYGGVAQ